MELYFGSVEVDGHFSMGKWGGCGELEVYFGWVGGVGVDGGIFGWVRRCGLTINMGR